MIIISQNLSNFDFSLPNDAIFRINLAWVNSIEELKSLLERHSEHKIFLDLPIGRTKPPDNKYSYDDLLSILNIFKNIKYFAISNVNSKHDLEPYVTTIPEHITIVPKIESPEGVKNIKEIVNFLGDKKTVMLDHDDLFSNTLKQNQSPVHFKEYFTRLVNYCNSNDVELLRTIGVVFSDQEKRVTEYMK
ncbi:MAG: hypothetical protein ACW9W3_02700 [Candidatus Nitrosopumilus sp. bin_68KS]